MQEIVVSQDGSMSVALINATRDDFEEILSEELTEAYHALMSKKLNWKHAAYILWLATPKQLKEGMPQTRKELAKALGYKSVKHLYKVKERRHDFDALLREARLAILAAHESDCMMAMIESASTPDRSGHSDRKMMFEMTGLRGEQEAELDNTVEAIALAKWRDEYARWSIVSAGRLYKATIGKDYKTIIKASGLIPPNLKRPVPPKPITVAEWREQWATVEKDENSQFFKELGRRMLELGIEREKTEDELETERRLIEHGYRQYKGEWVKEDQIPKEEAQTIES